MITIDDGRDFFFQWDTNRYLTVTEDFQELHFSKAKFGKATAVKVEDGKVKVPDEMLTCSGELYVFGIVEEDGKFTKIEKTFIVEKRPKPENYDGKSNIQIEFEKVYALIGNLEELNTEQKTNLVSAINEIFEMAKNSGGGDSDFDEEMLDEKINDLKVELIGTADDEANKDTIKGAKQLAFDLVHSLENRVVKTAELNGAINTALLQAKESGQFDGDDGLSAYQIWLSQGNTGSEADFLESLKGDAYNLTEADKDEIVETVKTEVPLVKVAEQPTFVDSVDEMTDTSKVYVMPDGYFYGYREIENYNLFKISEVSFSSRLQDDVAGITSSTTGNFVTGWIPVKYGKYYGASILFEGERKIKNMSYQRANLKLSDGTIIVYNKGKVPYVAIDGCKILDIKHTNAVAIQLQFTATNDSASILDTPDANVLSNYKPMMVEANTPEDAYSKALNIKYIDGDSESGAEWYNTGLAYNQPVNYEERVIKVESDVSDIKKDLADFQDDLSNIKDNITNPVSMSPYYRSVNYGLISSAYYKGVGISYENSNFNRETQYADFITAWKALVNSHSGYVTETALGSASDGQTIYLYDFKPVRITNQQKPIPKIIIIAGQHGFEKSNIYGLYYFVDNLLNRWTEHPTLEYLRNHVELLIIPVLNTYGFDHLEYKNANGVNLNRNYDSNWEYLNDVTSTQYGGEAPFDQPETQIVRDLLNGNKDASLVIDFHTNGGVSVTKYEDVNWCAICPNTDTYYNRMLDAVAYHLSALTAHFNIDYALNQPDVMMGHMTTNSGTGLLRSWATDNNFVGVLIEGFNGFPNEERFIGRVYKANEEIIVNWLITALNYLSK